MKNPHQLPTRQREALFLAAHGPILKGYKPQLKALVKKGLLDDEHRLTEDGEAAYGVLVRPFSWAGMPSVGTRGAVYSGSIHFGVLSEDGETLYVSRHAGHEPAVAYDASTVPRRALVALGAVPRPLEVVK